MGYLQATKLMKKRNDINHIMRNGLVDIQYVARKAGQMVDRILARCKDMEEALDKVKEKNKEEQKKAFRAEL
jgi:hypothetical protein